MSKAAEYIALIALAAWISLVLWVGPVDATHIPKLSDLQRDRVTSQLDAWFPDSVVTEWRIRTYMKRQRMWLLRVHPVPWKEVGYRDLLVTVQGFRSSVTNIHIRETVLDHTGKSTKLWVPHSDLYGACVVGYP